MDEALMQRQERFHVKQKVALAVNKYEVTAAGPDGADGETVAFAQQKRMVLKERVAFYESQDEERLRFAFRARSVVDLGAGYDVTDADGQVVGTFEKKFRSSLLRSTWMLRQEGQEPLTGRERSTFVALVRRVWQVVPFVDMLPFAWPYHFDFTGADGRTVMSVTKKFSLVDRYVLDIASPDLDRRLAIAQAVALDALQSR
ncbi:hypothetical protein [Streptomyces sp. MA15]|uniref:hypothetical protein n=1 Tax=unclassified Streptomyces TaxID=2593676 RepID=UPI0025AF6D19|nr:hypothetical protein [Streptomyces sp. MA15]MDN3272241.1 hypothetical protein [Streptomyces sp. MA15]